MQRQDLPHPHLQILVSSSKHRKANYEENVKSRYNATVRVAYTDVGSLTEGRSTRAIL